MRHRLIHHHPGHGPAVFFLLGGVNAVGLGVHGQAVDFLLYGKILQLAEVIGVVFLEYGNGAAVAGFVDAAQSGMVLDDVAAFSQRQVDEGRVLFQVEDGHQVVVFAGKKGAAVLHVQSHAVIAAAAAHAVAGHHLVGLRVNDGENILVLQIHVHLAGGGIVLRHAGFAVEGEILQHGVGAHINDGFGFAALVGDVKLVKGRSVGA